MGGYAGYILQTFFTLVAVCAIAYAILYGARRLGIGRPSGPIRLLGHLPLDPRRAIYVVGVGRQVIVVGASEAGLTKLIEIAPTDVAALSEAATPESSRVAFRDVLTKVRASPSTETTKPAEAGRDRDETGSI
jgi:flagellar biogenesis protein FliO